MMRITLAAYLLAPLPLDLQTHILKFTVAAIQNQPDNVCMEASFWKLFANFKSDYTVGMGANELRMASKSVEDTVTAAIERASRVPFRYLNLPQAKTISLFISYVKLLYPWIRKLTIVDINRIHDKLTDMYTEDNDLVVDLWTFPMEYLINSHEPFELWQAYWLIYEEYCWQYMDEDHEHDNLCHLECHLDRIKNLEFMYDAIKQALLENAQHIQAQ